MANQLNGKKIAFLVANEGVEQVELTAPWEAVENAGGEPVLVATETGKVQAFNHLDKGDTFEATVATGDLDAADYAGVVLPGGVANPDQLRTDESAVSFLREWAGAGRPIAAICHGPWTLVEADVVRDRTLTSWPSLRTDLRNVSVARGGPHAIAAGLVLPVRLILVAVVTAKQTLRRLSAPVALLPVGRRASKPVSRRRVFAAQDQSSTPPDHAYPYQLDSKMEARLPSGFHRPRFRPNPAFSGRGKTAS